MEWAASPMRVTLRWGEVHDLRGPVTRRGHRFDSGIMSRMRTILRHIPLSVSRRFIQIMPEETYRGS
jgi:hypothetical protein